MPLPFLLSIFFLGLILLCFSKKQKAAKCFLIISFSGLLLLSILPITQSLVQPLEAKYPPIMQKTAARNFDYILVLGSGGVADPKLAITGQLSATALSRFSEALRLYRANAGAKLVVSGSGFGDLKTHAQLLEKLAITMGIPKSKIIRLDSTLDTDDEAKLMSLIVKHKKSVLVTSATHMERAIQLFKKYDAYPTPAPANYLAPELTGKVPLNYYIPSSQNLDKTTKAWHEYLGEIQNWVKMKLDR